MSAFIESNDHLEEWLADELPSDLLLTPLSDEFSNEVVDLLKSEADRYWNIDPNKSLVFASRIVSIGEVRGDVNQIALGTMAKSDAHRKLGHTDEAWDLIEQAGDMFQKTGNEVGWARTRIGRLFLSLNLNRISEGLADAERAHEIFTRYKDEDKLVRIELQIGGVQNYLGNQQRALELFKSALSRAKGLGEEGQRYVGMLYENIGLTFNALGDFRQSSEYYEKAHELAVARQEVINIARVESSMAEIAQAQGLYRRALTLLNTGLERLRNDLPYDATLIQYHMVECYLDLNRRDEARKLAKTVVKSFRTLKEEYELARALLILATVEAAEGNFLEAGSALDEAETLFLSRGAASWIATIRLWRGRMALKLGNTDLAYQESVFAAEAFGADDQQVNEVRATLLRGQALFALGDYPAAETA